MTHWGTAVLADEQAGRIATWRGMSVSEHGGSAEMRGKGCATGEQPGN